MTDNLPAYDANPDALQEVCEVLREGGLEESELHEEIEDRGEASINKNTDYGIKLGFLETDEEKVEATTRGQKYGYGNLPSERENQLFKDCIKEYQFYQDLLEVVDGEIQDINNTPCLVRDGITREIRINFEFEAGDRVLESAAATFLKTMDAAGFGEYKQGRSGYPTRLELSEDFDELGEEFEEPSEEGTAESERTDESDESNEESNGVQEPEVKDDEVEQDTDNGQNDAKERESLQITQQQNSGKAAINIDIEIEISSKDWDMEEVSTLIQEVQNIDESL